MIALLLCLFALTPAAALPQGKRDQPRNAPQNCPWCHGDKAVMEKAGLFSHGGFEFGATDTARVDRLLGGKDIYWIESRHFELGMVLSPYRVGNDEAKKVRAELTELAELLPEVDPKTRILDPWLRLHLYALRSEKVWLRFLEVAQVKESDFPDGKSVWIIGTPYMGEGPYVGQKGKYEMIVLPTPSDQVTFLHEHFGLSVKRTQRWNRLETDSLIVVTNLQENELTDDVRLHNHVVFNLTHNLLDGFRHYSYDSLRWQNEGLAHSMERELNPRFNTYDSSEGADHIRVNREDWDAECKKLVAGGEAPRLAELTTLRTFAEFDLADHYACWSMTKFMITTQPQGYACLLRALHGRKGADGMPDSENLQDAQRQAFQECLGMSYSQFDAAWQAWVLTQGGKAKEGG